MRCYRYSKSPFSTRCVDDKRRYSEDETSTFAESAPPSCGYLHISISSAQHRGCRRRAARTQTLLADTLSYIFAHTHTHTHVHTHIRSLRLSILRSARVPLSVCARVCVLRGSSGENSVVMDNHYHAGVSRTLRTQVRGARISVCCCAFT